MTTKPKSELKDNLMICVVLMLISIITTYFGCSGCRTSWEWFAKFAGFTASMWISLWLGNAYTSTWVSRFVSWTDQPVKRFLAGMVVMVVYTSITVYLLIVIFRVAFVFDVGDSLGMIYGSLLVTFVITTFMHSRGFLTNWKQAALDAEVARRERMNAEYQALRNQVNPHFLFNSLNALTNLVYQDQDKAVKFIKQLSTVYRYVLSTRDKELVSLEEELSFLNSYLFLQQIRFGEKLKLHVDLPGEGQVAPLVLQMLVENAIKHNIIADEQPLTIQVYREDRYVVVQNNLQQKSIPSDESTGAGLENIKKRYTFLSTAPVDVQVSDQSFKVLIPIIFN